MLQHFPIMLFSYSQSHYPKCFWFYL